MSNPMAKVCDDKNNGKHDSDLVGLLSQMSRSAPRQSEILAKECYCICPCLESWHVSRNRPMVRPPRTSVTIEAALLGKTFLTEWAP